MSEGATEKHVGGYQFLVLSEEDRDLIEQIESLEKEVFGAGGLNIWMLSPLIRHGLVCALVNEERLVGASCEWILSLSSRDTAHLLGMSVRQGLRGIGLGRLLLRSSLSVLLRSGITRADLTVDPANQLALALYRSEGFREYSFSKDEYGKGEDRIIMRLEL